jgi:hypothetical protein
MGQIMYINKMLSPIQQDRHYSSGLPRVLERLAVQQAEIDSHRLRRLSGETLQQTTSHERNPLKLPPTELSFLSSDGHTVDRSVDAVDQGRLEIDGAVPFNSRARLAVQTEFARYANVTIPRSMGPEVEQTIAGHAGAYQVGPSHLLETITGSNARVHRSESRSDLRNTNDQIAQFAPSYTKLLNDQNRTAVLERMSARTGDEFTRLLADKRTSDRIRAQAETNRGDRQLPPEVFENYEKNRDMRSLLGSYQGLLPEGMKSSEPALERTAAAPAFDSIAANFGASIAQGDKRTSSTNISTNLDRDGGYGIDGGPFSNVTSSQSVQDALAAATEEVERLTAAVRRTIHELERARGSVQPALPALPLNFGSLRLS